MAAAKVDFSLDWMASVAQAEFNERGGWSSCSNYSSVLARVVADVADVCSSTSFFLAKVYLAADKWVGLSDVCTQRLALVREHFHVSTFLEGCDALGTVDRRTPDFFAIVAGNLGRADACWGLRGYRRVLIEAGSIAQHLVCAAARSGLHATMLTEFHDCYVNEVIDVDGQSVAALVVIALFYSTESVPLAIRESI